MRERSGSIRSEIFNKFFIRQLQGYKRMKSFSLWHRMIFYLSTTIIAKSYGTKSYELTPVTGIVIFYHCLQIFNV